MQEFADLVGQTETYRTQGGTHPAATAFKKVEEAMAGYVTAVKGQAPTAIVEQLKGILDGAAAAYDDASKRPHITT